MSERKDLSVHQLANILGLVNQLMKETDDLRDLAFLAGVAGTIGRQMERKLFYERVRLEAER